MNECDLPALMNNDNPTARFGVKWYANYEWQTAECETRAEMDRLYSFMKEYGRFRRIHKVRLDV